ncbi:MAG: BTB/POZ domain-containing protein [Parachlamydiaceae bacterium]
MNNINSDLKHTAKVFSRAARFKPRVHRRYVKLEREGGICTTRRKDRTPLKSVFRRTQRQIQETFSTLTYEDLEKTQRALSKISLATETLRDRYARRAGNIFVRLGWIKPREKMDTLYRADQLLEKVQAAQEILAKISEGGDDLSSLKNQFLVLNRRGFLLKLAQNSEEGMLFETCRPVIEELATERFIQGYPRSKFLPYVNYRQLSSAANLRLPQGHNDEFEPLRHLLRNPRRNFFLPNNFKVRDLPIWMKIARDCGNRHLLAHVYIAETRSITAYVVYNIRRLIRNPAAQITKRYLADLQMLQRTQLLKNDEFRRAAGLDGPFFRDLADLEEPITTEDFRSKAILFTLQRHTNLDHAHAFLPYIFEAERLNRALASNQFTLKDTETLHTIFMLRLFHDDQLAETFKGDLPLVHKIMSKNPRYEEEEEPNLQTSALIYMYQVMELDDAAEVAKNLFIFEALNRLNKLFFDKDWKDTDYRNLLQVAKEDLIHDEHFVEVFGDRIPLLQSLNKLGQYPEDYRFALRVAAFILQVEKLCDPAQINFEVIHAFEMGPKRRLDRVKENGSIFQLATLGKHLSRADENLYAEFRKLFPRIAELQRLACLPHEAHEPFEIFALRFSMDQNDKQAWTHLMQASYVDRKLPFTGLQIEMPNINEVSAGTMAVIQQKLPYVAHAMIVKSRGNTHPDMSLDDQILWRKPVVLGISTYNNHGRKFSNTGQKLLQFEFYGDCSVVVNGRERKVDSKLIQRVLQGQNVVDENGRLKLPVELTPKELSVFLQYCYTGSIALHSTKVLFALYAKADALGSEMLKNHCCAMVIGSVSKNNCLEIYQKARALGITPIMKYCSCVVQAYKPDGPYTIKQRAIVSSMVKSHFDRPMDMPPSTFEDPITSLESDFRLIGNDDVEVKTSLPLLATQSSYFEAVLRNNTLLETDLKLALFEQFNGTTLSHIAHFAEANTLPENLSTLDLYELMMAADYFLMPDLTQKILTKINNLKPNDIISAIQSADFEGFSSETLRRVIAFLLTDTVNEILSEEDKAELKLAATYFLLPKLLLAVDQPPPLPPIHVVAPPIRNAPVLATTLPPPRRPILTQLPPPRTPIIEDIPTQRYRIEHVREFSPYPPGIPMGNNMYMTYREVKRPY